MEDPEQVVAGLLEFVAHNPEMTQRGYYALPRDTGGQVDQAALRAAAETRVMIVICLGQELLHRRKQNSPRTKALMRAVVRLHTSIYRLSNLRHAGAAVDNRWS